MTTPLVGESMMTKGIKHTLWTQGLMRCGGQYVILLICQNYFKNLTKCWAEVEVFLNEQFIVSIDTAEDVAVPLPVLNTEINVMCNPPLPIPLHVRTDCKNCAKRKDELRRMAKVNRMLKQQLKMNNHRSRHIHNLKQALQRKAKIESNLRSKIRH